MDDCADARIYGLGIEVYPAGFFWPALRTGYIRRPDDINGIKAERVEARLLNQRKVYGNYRKLERTDWRRYPSKTGTFGRSMITRQSAERYKVGERTAGKRHISIIVKGYGGGLYDRESDQAGQGA